MGKPSNEKKGWIETIYGDYWSKSRKLIIAGVFIPIIFSFLSLFWISSLLSLVLNIPHDPITHYNNSVNFFSVMMILIIFIGVVCFSLIFSAKMSTLYKIFEDPLRVIHEEIFVKKKPNAYQILEKNFCLSIIQYGKKLIPIFILLVGLIILVIPSLIVGYLAFLACDFYAASNIANLTGYIPFIGEQLESFFHFLFVIVPSEFQVFFQSFSPLLQSLLLVVPIMLFFPIFDLIEASTNHRQRGSYGHILKNGLRLTLGSINLPFKIGNFCYITFLCLFTDQKTTSLNIPVINIDNIETAMQKALGESKKCYVAKLPLDPKKLLSDIKACPPDFAKEIDEEFKKVSQRTMVLAKNWYESQTSRKQGIVAAKAISIIFGINEADVRTYAVVRKQPPNHMSRIILILWCTDPLVKTRILNELNALESPE